MPLFTQAELGALFVAGELAENATYQAAAGGDPATVPVIPNQDPVDFDLGNTGHGGVAWTVTVRAADLPAGAPARNDTFVLTGVGSFRVRTADPDADGAVYVLSLDKTA